MKVRHRPGSRAVQLAAVTAASIIAAACSSNSSSSSKTTSATSSSATGASTTVATHSGPTRGFDGTTLKVASFGIKGQLPGVEFGVRGRIQRFNATNELPGVKIDYVEFADDKLDPATALSEGRRLVTSDQVFAIVGDVSANNPGDYFRQQHVPYFGWAFDSTYCSPAPSTDVWGFGTDGCLISVNPKQMPDGFAAVATYVKKTTGKAAPTISLFGNDTASGQGSVKNDVAAFRGAGFDVVYAKGLLPPPPISDYTPYVQGLLTSDHGKAPDAIECLLSTDCIPMYKGLLAAGFKGIYSHNLYSDALAPAMKGSVTQVPFVPFDIPSPALDQMKADVAAAKPDQKLDTGVTTGYFSADQFIQALVAAAHSGGITPENVQAKAARMTWEIKGLAGPLRYPDSTVEASPACFALAYDDGTAWKTVVPYACSDKTFPVTAS